MSERERFLREFERRLRLRGAKRADVLEEVACHIDEGVAAGEDERAVVARLGAPQEIAARLNRPQNQRFLVVFAAVSLGALAAVGAVLASRSSPDAVTPPGRLVPANPLIWVRPGEDVIFRGLNLRCTFARGGGAEGPAIFCHTPAPSGRTRGFTVDRDEYFVTDADGEGIAFRVRR